MRKETAYQQTAINAARKLGGEGFKLSNAWIVGIPDVYLVYDARPWIIEFKRINSSVKQQRKLSLTTPQETWLKRLGNAGQNVGVLTVALTCDKPVIHWQPITPTEGTRTAVVPTHVTPKACTHLQATPQGFEVFIKTYL